MKKTNIFKIAFILTIGLASIFSSCKKDAGPAGPQGAQGAQGPQGLQGTPGPAGSTVLSGNGTPTSTTGANGDFYLDLTSSLFYGPKTAAGWGTGFAMKGANGAAGTNGNKIINGTTIPGATDGSIGDYYLNTTNYLLYGPKIASGWGVGTSLIGTANVKYSGWATSTDPINVGYGKTSIRSARINTTAITPAIINSGVVLVYARRNSDLILPGGTTPLPFSYDLSVVENIKATVNFSLGTSVIYINTTTSNNSLYAEATLEYRYVVIPGGVAIAAAKNINLNDLQAVEKYFNIEK
ncbi:collagen-like protein [Pedobacter sp. Hv1]|uniref:collagen-like protein n=1 Tax=Pedobacter sp. Hv1 TaxID=1740090 RepID=UPI0006D8CEE7|nr:collagen-like protein [Pedobacter sp. Hv1]KQC00182.1 hypothetical protein AQF98_11805 [Pedobacter sp. Hv1]